MHTRGIIIKIIIKNAICHYFETVMTRAEIPQPVNNPSGAAVIVKVNHLVFDLLGAKASVQTGKKIAKMTWQAPEMNLAAAYSLTVLTTINANKEAI